jgi:YesN/AraC family two-component response regulator
MPIDHLPAGLRVLLAEDDAFLRRTTAQVLSGLNPKSVATAENGKVALSFLNRNEIDLLITDVQMPEMNGLELIKQIRLGNTSGSPELRTIVVTSFSTLEVVAASLALDVNGFLVKPITPASAASKIGIAMQERVSLKTRDTYQAVNTDLDSIALTAATQSSKVNAALPDGNRQAAYRAGGKTVSLEQLQPGMRLVENLTAKTGVALVTAGHELNESMINRIHELSEVIAARYVRIQ